MDEGFRGWRYKPTPEQSLENTKVGIFGRVSMEHTLQLPMPTKATHCCLQKQNSVYPTIKQTALCIVSSTQLAAHMNVTLIAPKSICSHALAHLLEQRRACAPLLQELLVQHRAECPAKDSVRCFSVVDPRSECFPGMTSLSVSLAGMQIRQQMRASSY